MTTTIIKRK